MKSQKNKISPLDALNENTSCIHICVYAFHKMKQEKLSFLFKKSTIQDYSLCFHPLHVVKVESFKYESNTCFQLFFVYVNAQYNIILH